MPGPNDKMESAVNSIDGSCLPWGRMGSDEEFVLRHVLNHYGFTRVTAKSRQYVLRVLGFYKHQQP